MRTVLPLLFAAATFGTCVLAHAGTAAPAPTDTASRAAQRTAMRQQFADAIDTNHDGTISRDEYRAWVDQRFARLDGNGDGRVDAAEIADSPAARQRVQKRADRFVQRFDTSGTGKVSLADFEARAMQRFDRIADGASSVPVDEFAAAGRHAGRRQRAPDAAAQ